MLWICGSLFALTGQAMADGVYMPGLTPEFNAPGINWAPEQPHHVDQGLQWKEQMDQQQRQMQQQYEQQQEQQRQQFQQFQQIQQEQNISNQRFQ